MKAPRIVLLRSRWPIALLSCLVVLAPPFGFAAASAKTVFNIVDYGAKPDGSAPATDALRRAIAAAKAAGGGTIEVPAGNTSPAPSSSSAT